jgi:hypothetical protein
VQKSFDFINVTQESDDASVRNLGQVGVFEVLGGSAKGVEAAQTLLSAKGMESFNKIKQNFKPT